MLADFKGAVEKADELIMLYGRRSADRLARELGIEILERDFKEQKGAYKTVLKNRFIFVKRDLCDGMKNLVIFHEIGRYIARKYSLQGGCI